MKTLSITTTQLSLVSDGSQNICFVLSLPSGTQRASILTWQCQVMVLDLSAAAYDDADDGDDNAYLRVHKCFWLLPVVQPWKRRPRAKAKSKGTQPHLKELTMMVLACLMHAKDGDETYTRVQEEVFLTIARGAAMEAAKSDGMQPHLKELPFWSTCAKVGVFVIVTVALGVNVYVIFIVVSIFTFTLGFNVIVIVTLAMFRHRHFAAVVAVVSVRRTPRCW